MLHFRRRLKPASTFERLSQRASDVAGRTGTVAVSVLLVLLWAVTGPLFDFSDTWQLILNTATSAVTFVMVFLIQRAQNKDTMAVQLKLNEIIAALHGASNRLIAVEELSEDDLRVLRERYQRLCAIAERGAPHRSVSIEAMAGEERDPARAR